MFCVFEIYSFLSKTEKIGWTPPVPEDIEFTIEKGKLWMLQTRSGKRTTHAAIQIAVDMTNEGRAAAFFEGWKRG